MRKMKIRKILIASAVMLSAFQLSGSKAFSQDLSALDCKVLSDEDSSREDYLKKFRKSYLETRSLAQMSSMVNFFDIAVNDCNAIIIVSLTPKENMGGEKEAWIFQREPWALIGSN